MSTSAAREERPRAIPSSENTTPFNAAGSATIVKQASAPAAASAGESATVAPARPSCWALAAVRFHTDSSWPASSRRRAIGAPIWPKPQNPILISIALRQRLLPER
jgi:hypothetical protein